MGAYGLTREPLCSARPVPFSELNMLSVGGRGPARRLMLAFLSNGGNLMTASRLLVMHSFICVLSGSLALAQFGSRIQYFPQFAINGGAQTSFTIHNPGEGPITVDLFLTRSNGSPFLSDQVAVEAGGTETVTYGEPGGDATAGWARLTSAGEFSATLFYRIAGVGNVGVLPSPEAQAMKVFTYVQGVTNTGFAVANPSETESSDLLFQIHDAAGQLLRESHLTLGPRQHRAFFFSETPYEVEENGSVTVRATNPVVALALRLDGALMSSVGVVVPGLPIRGEWNETSPSIIGGYRENRVREGMVGGTISGGGNSPDHPDGGANFVTGNYGTVGGGKRNTTYEIASVGGGDENVASGIYSAVGGGRHNTASAQRSTVGGGDYNEATGCSSTVGGGSGNDAIGTGSTVGGGGGYCSYPGNSSGYRGNTASGFMSTVAGGWRNDATGDNASITGGSGNLASGEASTVCGGYENEASGQYSTVGGGWRNTANGDYSFAAGHNARAIHIGAFVWADDRETAFQSTSPRQFLIRALGGVGINTNSPQGTLDVNGSIYQHGNTLHADYVFDPDYKVETIEEHSRLM